MIYRNNIGPFERVLPQITQVKLGLLYNEWASIDVRNIANTGYKLPASSDWALLCTYLGGDTIVAGKLKETGLTYWMTPNTGATNETNMNVKGAGYRSSSFAMVNMFTWFRTSTSNGNSYNTNHQAVRIDYDSIDVALYINHTSYHGSSIRLLKENPTAQELALPDFSSAKNYTGNDGKIYRTVKIGTQVWLADNLAETRFRNGDIIPFAGDNGINFTNAEWAALTTAGVCPYNNDWSNV